ncbi:MAG: hypothetical protein LBU65_06000 [Planctomycetaceae bacterium]|jgi:hypothetical protein|nr:hypothetical protein [Planctomycetaceae bacterium]
MTNKNSCFQFVLLFLVALFASTAIGETYDLKTIIRELEKGLLAYDKSLEGHEIHVITTMGPPISNEVSTFEMRGIIGKGALITEGRDYDIPDKSFYHHIVGTNSEYLFEIQRYRAANSPWRIDNLFPHWEQRKDLARRLDPFFRCQFFAGGVVIDNSWSSLEFCSLDGFEITDIQQIDSDGYHLVKVSFQIPLSSGIDYRAPPYSGFLVFNTSLNWLLKEASIKFNEQTEEGNDVTVRCEMSSDFKKRDNEDGYYVSRTLAKYFEGEKELPNWEKERIFTIKKIEYLDDSRFTLSYYGFPEPDFDSVSHPNRFRYILLTINGIVLLLLLVYFIYRKHQKRKNETE